MSTQSPTLFERVSLKLAQSKENLARKKEQMEQEALAAKELKEQLKRRMDAVAAVEARIERAKGHLEGKKRKVEEFNRWVLRFWGDDMSNESLYGPLVAMKAAIEDFPRVLTYLKGELQAAQKELSDFEKAHDI
jgi:DNA repair exonuclease SbcCD ATPase subunit